MPVMVWGNGACSDNSLSHQNFLLEIASYGIVIVVSGVPNGGGGTSAQTMTQSIDWAVANAGKGNWVNMDASRIAVAGMSCGGIEAYANSLDDRVSAVGIFNSGQYDAAGTNANVPPINKPIFFFLGGPSDIAYQNVSRGLLAARAPQNFHKLTDGRVCETTQLCPQECRPGLATIPAATAARTASPRAELSVLLAPRTSVGFSGETRRRRHTSRRTGPPRTAGRRRARISRILMLLLFNLSTVRYCARAETTSAWRKELELHRTQYEGGTVGMGRTARQILSINRKPQSMCTINSLNTL